VLRPIASRRAARVVTTLITALVLAAPTAHATSEVATHPEATTFPGSACPPNSLCMYRDYNFKGGGVALTRDRGARSFLHPDLRFNDQMSSWSNDSGIECAWYKNTDFTGDSHPMRDGFRVNLPRRQNDQASSAHCDL
jgi:Peptidase inhibitor family I36